ncbi:MAG: APC family permease [Holophagaceae bacterium]|nr:APC family permease [Holophagaceae bacterium]
MAEPSGYRRDIGFFSATMIISGSMIGSGIFIVSADIVRQVHTGPMLLLTWCITGALTLCATLSYGELTGMMPKAGGMYVYLREIYGPMAGFLYGWACFLVIECGSIAAVAVGSGRYMGSFFPAVNDARWLMGPWHIKAWQAMPGIALGPYEFGLTTARAVGIAVIFVIALVNTYGVKLGAWTQNLFSVAKLGAMAALILSGLLLAPKILPVAGPYVPPMDIAPVTLLAALVVAQAGSFFSCDGWHYIGNVGSEIRNPKRTLPLALLAGPTLVIGLYLLANLAYLRLLGPTGIATATEDRVGAAALGAVFGPLGGSLMAGAIMVSMFGFVNGASFTTARVYQAMGEDGLFIGGAGKLNRFGVPAWALWLQTIWACILTLTGTFEQLVEYCTFAQLLAVVSVVAGVVVLRIKKPDLARPYRTWGYPAVPMIYLLGAGGILVFLLRFKPGFTWPGLVLVLLGVPVYFWRSHYKSESGQRPPDHPHIGQDKGSRVRK